MPQHTLVVGSEGMGRWMYSIFDLLIQRAFPQTTIIHDDSRNADLIIRSHFLSSEKTPVYTCPYIAWSGEPYRVQPKPDYSPIIEVNTVSYPTIDNSFYLPHIISEIPCTARPAVIAPKRWCAAYAFSHTVLERELLFRMMRRLEPTCYGFGRCSRTSDNPFDCPKHARGENGDVFHEFGFVIAMENSVAPGYITEKIGYAFNAGTVPIYWGDTNSVNEFFNPDAFLNVSSFPTAHVAAETAVQIWRDPQKLQRYLDAPLTLTNTLRDYEAVRTEYRPWQAPFIDRLREAFPDLS